MSFSEKILKSAQEGIVLLKNEDNALPFSAKDNISIFGRAQFEFYRCGTGSGGSVHVPYITNLTDSLCEVSQSKGFEVNLELAELYKDFISKNPFDNGGGQWAAEPWSQVDMPLTPAIVDAAASKSSKAVFIIGRNSGEDRDYKLIKGSWYLKDEEIANLKLVCQKFDDVILVFNTSGIIETNWINSDDFSGKIKSVVYAWEGGQESGRACATILAGVVTPSGKLTDTIAYDIKDYPSTKNYGELQNKYEEDIYVGYRYFNTFAKDKIMYPFGFGLSYTTFKSEVEDSKVNGTSVSVTVKVTNTGNTYNGKEIIQTYCAVPQGKLSKPAVQLCGFAKTPLLEPGKSASVTIDFDLKQLASYDDSGATGSQFAWVLEEGDYIIYTGTDSLRLTEVTSVSVKEKLIIEQLEQCAAPVLEYKRLKAGKKLASGEYEQAYEAVPLSKVDMAERIKSYLPAELKPVDGKKIDFDDVKKDRSLLDSFIAQLSVKDLATMVRGEGMLSRKVTPGIAAAYGGLSESLHSYKIPVAGCSDGPSGIRMDTGKQASLMPIGTQLACSWNIPLVQELFECEGKELAENQIDALLGPGINIHRNPLNGRNFEYFSEDPFLTGKMAMVQVEGLYKGGSNGTVKHYALNSQEGHRRFTDSVVSERAIREIYIKPFEMAVKDGYLKSIMTSYNAINGHWAASNYDLVNTILRKQWGYKGLVMTDWWADMNDCVTGGESSLKDICSMIKAGNDVYMVVDNDGAEVNVFGDNLEDSIANGKLTLGELQYCVKNVLNFILDAPVSKRPLRALKTVAHFEASKSVPADAVPLTIGTSFVPAEKKSYLLHIEYAGNYSISGVYKKVEDTVSQSATNILVNKEPAGSFECRSTLGKDVSDTAGEIQLDAGDYEITMEHTKPGIEVVSLRFSFIPPSPVAIGIFK